MIDSCSQLKLHHVFILLLASAILLPYVPIAGPLSTDDLMPLVAVGLALITVPFAVLDRRHLLDVATLALLFFAIIVLISSAANAETFSDFVRMTGKSTGRLFFYFFLILSTRILISDSKRAETALFIVTALATVEAAFCIWAYKNQYQGPYGIGIADVPNWSVLKGSVRVHGTFSGALSIHEKAQVSANFLASYLILSIPVGFGLFLRRRNTWIRAGLLIAVSMQLLTLYLTYTRASLIALGCGALAMGWLLNKRAWAISAVIVVATIALSVPAMRAKFLKEGHNRYSLWSASFNTFKDSPVTGVGDGKYMKSLTQNHHIHDTKYGVANATAHNSLLLSAANYGFGGFLAHAFLYLSLVCVAIGTVLRSRSENKILAAAIASAILSYLVQDQFNNLHYIPKVSTQMWLLFALLPAFALGARDEKATSA